MLAEWLRHLCTRAPAHLKAMGYVKELIAIEARHHRCRAAWAPHLENCKKLILDAAFDVNPGRVTVLGSGPLLDVPVEELSKTFREVELVDIFHMPATQKRVAKMPNVRLVTEDLTGGGETEWLAGADLVVSANLLSQLPLLPMELVQGKEEADAFARGIIEHHLDMLTALPGRVALVCETERVISDGDEVLQSIDPLFGATVPAADKVKRWTWDIAPRPEINRRIDLSFRMAGIADLKAAAR